MKKFSKQWWKEWLKYASIRAGHAFCQGLIGMTAVETKNLTNIDWKKTLLTCFIIVITSYAKSFLVGVPEIELSEYKVKEIK